jgi:hypothetical protein
MFIDLVKFPIKSSKLDWKSKVIVREIDKGPQLYIRLELIGTTFPVFNTIPFVRVGKAVTHHVFTADDYLSVRAYFERALPEDGVVEFGYENQAILRFPQRYTGIKVKRLDPKRLPKSLQYQDQLFEHLGLE